MRKFLTILFMTLLAYAVGYDVGWAETETETFDLSFSNIGTNGWSNSYANHTVIGTAATVTLAKSSKQGSNVTNYPVTKAGPITIALNSSYSTNNITAVVLELQQWTTKTKTVLLSTSNDGSSYTNTGVTSDNFSLSASDLSAKYLQFSFSETDNQVGIKSITITYEDGGDDPQPTTYSITGTGNLSNGSVTASKTSGITENENITLTISPNTGYELGTLTVDGNDVTSSVSNDKYTFNMPAHDVAVSATFTAAAPSTGGTMEFVQTSSSAGTLSGAPSATPSVTASFSNTYTSNKEQITKNNTMTLTISNMPSIYKITGIRLSVHNNKSAGSGTATITMNNTTFGTVGISNYSSNNGYVIIPVTLTSTPACNGNLVVQIDASESSVYCDHFYIDYELIPQKTYNVTVTQPAEGGSVSARPSGEKVVNSGDAVEVTATPATGYELSVWNITGISESSLSASTNPITVHATGNVIASATFSKITYTIDPQFDSNAGSITNLASSGQIGDNVTFTVTTKWGKQIGTVKWKNLTTNKETTLTATGGNSTDGYTYAFTMPAAHVQVSATFVDYYPTVKIAGSANGRSTFATTDPLPVMTHSSNRTYSANVYFTGEENNDKVDYFYFLVDGEAVKAKANGNYWVTNFTSSFNPFYSSNSGDTDANLRIEPGVYTITISIPGTDRSQWSMSVTKNTYALAFNPAAGEVETGTSVSASCAQLASDIEAIQTADSGAQGSVTAEVSGDNSTWASSYEFAIADVGSKTIYGRAAIGNIAVTGTASYTVTKMNTSNIFELVTDASQLVANGKYIIADGKSGSVYVMSKTQNTNNRASVTNTANDNKITISSDEVVLTLGGDATNGWSFFDPTYDSNSGGYLYAANSASGKNNYLKTQASNDLNGLASISIDDTDNNAVITFGGSHNDRQTIRFNSASDQLIFSCYQSTSVQPVYLFKQVAEEEKDFEITYVAGTNGSVTGAEGANAGETVTVTVTAATGYAASGAPAVTTDDENNPSLSVTDNGDGTYSFTVPANLAEGSTITVTPPTFVPLIGITYVAEPTAGGTVSGPASAIEGDNVNVTVTPESDYQVQSVVYTWASGSRDITEGLSFLMPGSATTVTATFVKKPFNISVSSSHGEVSDMPATAVSGQEVTFTVTPNAGYVVSSVVLSFANTSQTLTADVNGIYSFTMPGQDVTITVTYFASEDYELLTDLADINYEDNYLIVAGADGTTYKTEGETVQVLSGVNSSNIGTNVSATLGENGILSSTAAMKTVTFSAGSTTGTYKMYIADNGYVNTSASGKLNVSNDVNDAVDLTLVVTANADTIKMGTNNVLRYNTGSPRFCFYTSQTGQVIRIFKLANQNKVKRPSVTGAAGQYLGLYNFIGKDNVTLATATDGATIEYSLDGGTNWTTYSEPFEISTNAAGNTVSVMARATKTGMEPSDAVTATFTCVAPTWHTKPCGDNWACNDTIFNNPVFIYPICSLANRNAYGKANCQFFYTTNGTTPTLASTEVPVPSSGEKFLFLDEVVELTMIPVINGIAGEPVSGNILFEPAAPVITLASGSYGGDQKTQLRTDTKTQLNGASWITKIYYFVETTSNTYKAFTFDADTGEPTAAAIAAGWQLYQPDTSPYIDILLANGEMQDLHAVTLTNFLDAPYDGTYSGASRTLNGTWTLSEKSVANYTLTTAPLDVIFSPAGGNYLYAKDVVLTPVNSIGGTTIYYTTDGTEPTTASAVYSAPIHVGPGSTTIKVYAVDSRLDPTDGGTFTKEYTYNIGVQEPLFSPFPGDYPGNGATKWGRQFKGVNEGDVTVEIFDVTPNAEIHYTYTEELTNSDHENYTYTEPADPTRSSTAYTEPIALKPGYTYIFKAIAYVGNQASQIRTRAFTVDQITSEEAAGYWMNVKAMNEEISTSTAKKFANPIEVIYMSTWRNNGNKPEYCFIRDNSGYGLVYFGGSSVSDYNGYTIFNPGDWLPGNSVGGKVSVWSESYINELGSSSGSITAWPTTAMANRAIIPETTTCQAIRDGWTYKVDGKPASISGDKAVYKQYVDPVNNKFGHYVHLRKNKITNVVRTGNNLTTENPGKLSGIITGELGTPLQYYDGFYLFSGYNGATAKTQDDFNAIQDKGGTFDVYAVVQFYGSNTTNSTYSYAPYEVFPIAFDYIFPPIFNLAGDGTAADMTNDNPERTRYEATTLTLSCETRGAVIMYKTSDMEDFAVYNGEIINVDKTMTIETYSLHSTEHFDQLESKVRTLTINMGSVEQPVISPESVMRAIGGESVNASISCATEGATIWYTTDGSDPRDDTNADRYEYNASGSNPALTGISSTTTVRAIAEADGFYSVEAEPKTYTFVKSNGIVYDLVTSEADLKEGAIYVIVSKEYNMAMQRSQKENNRDQSPVLFLQEGDEGYVAEKTKVYGNDDLAVFTLHKFAGTGPNWTLHTSNGVNNASIGYLYGQASGSTNQLKTEFTLDSEGKTEAYIEIDSDGTAHISFVKPDEPRYLRYNHSFNLFNSYTNESTGDPVYLYKKDAFPLANIEKKGVKNQQYTVADELIGVYAKGNKLWAKDQAVSIDANDKPEGYSDFLLEEAFIGEAKNELSKKTINVPSRYLQNNWVVLIMPEGTDAAKYVDAYIPAASVIGELTDDVNYTITLKQAPGRPINMSANELYVKNVYAPTSFVSTYWGENDSEIYFVKPKVQEVANIAWAVWDGSKFKMPENCPAGSFAISDFTLNEESAPTLETGKAYAFMAVMENGGSSLSGIRRLKSGDSPATFNIKPLNLTSSSPVTGISNVGGSVKEVKSVRVYNVAGVEQRELQPGVNIVVTTYTDGTRSTAKVLR